MFIGVISDTHGSSSTSRGAKLRIRCGGLYEELSLDGIARLGIGLFCMLRKRLPNRARPHLTSSPPSRGQALLGEGLRDAAFGQSACCGAIIAIDNMPVSRHSVMSRDIHNLKRQKGIRRSLRNRATPAERTLWQMLRNRQIDGKKFCRQYGIGPYIVDFFRAEESLAIELDGDVHHNPARRNYDRKRTSFLNTQDISVLRFENRLLLEQPDLVIEAIRRRLKKSSP